MTWEKPENFAHKIFGNTSITWVASNQDFTLQNGQSCIIINLYYAVTNCQEIKYMIGWAFVKLKFESSWLYKIDFSRVELEEN